MMILTNSVSASHLPLRSEQLASTEELIEEAQAGRMFILVDDEDRENEGDLVIAAEFCDAQAINFMARFGRGLICLSLTGVHCDRLGLPLMVQGNSTRISTAFTCSIEAAEGVTTGISAADRARTIQAAADPRARPGDIHSPGHVFPLRARDGGVLVRAGHTEASVDIPRLAGLVPAGVICEIMNDDGTMARLRDLLAFARLHGLKIGTIADLIAYRLRTETLLERRENASIRSEFGGDFQLVDYVDTVSGSENLALVKGQIDPNRPVRTKFLHLDLGRDLLGETGRGAGLREVFGAFRDVESGVIVLLDIGAVIRRTEAASQSASRHESRSEKNLRVYGIGAQILRDLGVRQISLVSESQPDVVALEGYGLSVIEVVSR